MVVWFCGSKHLSKFSTSFGNFDGAVATGRCNARKVLRGERNFQVLWLEHPSFI